MRGAMQKREGELASYLVSCTVEDVEILDVVDVVSRKPH